MSLTKFKYMDEKTYRTYIQAETNGDFKLLFMLKSNHCEFDLNSEGWLLF